MARHFVSKRDAKTLRDALAPLGISLPDVSIEIDERKGEKCFFVNGKPYVYVSDRTIPTLFLLNELQPEQMYVTVDDGAVPDKNHGIFLYLRVHLSDTLSEDISTIDDVWNSPIIHCNIHQLRLELVQEEQCGNGPVRNINVGLSINEKALLALSFIDFNSYLRK